MLEEGREGRVVARQVAEEAGILDEAGAHQRSGFHPAREHPGLLQRTEVLGGRGVDRSKDPTVTMEDVAGGVSKRPPDPTARTGGVHQFSRFPLGPNSREKKAQMALRQNATAPRNPAIRDCRSSEPETGSM